MKRLFDAEFFLDFPVKDLSFVFMEEKNFFMVEESGDIDVKLVILGELCHFLFSFRVEIESVVELNTSCNTPAIQLNRCCQRTQWFPWSFGWR